MCGYGVYSVWGVRAGKVENLISAMLNKHLTSRKQDQQKQAGENSHNPHFCTLRTHNVCKSVFCSWIL